MSPKDLCTVAILDRIIAAGVTVLKIEGRGRSPEYVKTTTSVYKEAIESILNNSFTKEKVSLWIEKLDTVYNRGFWEGHYLGEHTSDWNTNTYGSKATKKKFYIAKAIKYFSKIEVAEFLMETGELNKGDEIIIIGPTTGVIEIIITEFWLNEQIVPTVKKGDYFSFLLKHKVRPSDKMYIVKEI